MRTAFEAALADAGYFDVVINNAGSGHFGPIETMSGEMVREQFQTLVFGQIELCQLALAMMRTRGRGLIINITSLAARLPVPFMGAYNAAKAALASFTMSLQLELGHPHISLVDVQPGDIRTAFNDGVAQDETKSVLYDERLTRTWRVVDRNLKAAPGPEIVARRIVDLIGQNNPPPQITVGDVSQSLVAPTVFRLLPQSARVSVLRKYYRL